MITHCKRYLAYWWHVNRLIQTELVGWAISLIINELLQDDTKTLAIKCSHVVMLPHYQNARLFC